VPAPYLSIVITGRNDNYGGDFTARCIRALRFNHERLTHAGVPHEVIFIEWRPIPGRPLLGDEIRRLVPELTASLVTYTVDARYHDALTQNPHLHFQEFVAKNVGVRRAAGSYILTTNSDIYLSEDVVSMFACRVLRPMVLYRARRVDLKSSLDSTNLGEDVLADPRNRAAVNELRPPFFTNAAGDFLLLDRFSYHALRGFNEVFRAARIFVDANFCYHAAEHGILIVETGADVYHFGEGTTNSQRAAYADRPERAPWGWTWRKSVRYENPDEWGLGAAPAVECGPRSFRLLFDDRAVPPLVTLRRLTPASTP
jgi:hypothetical protein